MEELSADHALLGNVEYPLVRSKLRAWLVLEDFYTDIIEAAEKGDREEFVSSLYSYVSAAFSIPIETLQSCPWYEITRAFKQAYTINFPSIDFPILRRKMQEKISSTKDGWEYSGRTWYIWLHLFSEKYGWSIQYIENLSVDDGIALMQEILVNDQLEREWQWSLTEIAYPYDEHTKTSKFRPLERPDWMKPAPKPVKKVKVRASELPVGLVLKWDTDNNEYTRPL